MREQTKLIDVYSVAYSKVYLKIRVLSMLDNVSSKSAEMLTEAT